MRLLEVPVGDGDQPPDHGEAQPRQHEAQREYNQRPAPLRVDQRRENVLQEPDPPAGDLLLRDVAVAVLQHGAATDLAVAARPEVAASETVEFAF